MVRGRSYWQYFQTQIKVSISPPSERQRADMDAAAHSQDYGGYHVPIISQHSRAALRFLEAQVETLAGFLAITEASMTTK